MKYKKITNTVLASFILLGAHIAPSAATSLYWPERIGPCSTTLQACIDAADPGSDIEIDGSFQNSVDELRNPYHEIAESLSITKPLSIYGKSGIDVVFASGQTITVQLSAFVTLVNLVRISNLSLIRGNILINDRGAPNSTVEYTVEQVRFIGAATGITASAINIVRQVPALETNGGSNFFITKNLIDFQNDDNRQAAIFIGQASVPGQLAGALSGLFIYDNHIVRRNQTSDNDAGIQVNLGASQATTSLFGVRIFNNHVIGPFARPISINVNQYGSSSLPLYLYNNMLVKQDDLSISGGYAIDISNIDSVLTYHLNNNTIANNRLGAIRVSNGTYVSGSTTGNLYNNLIAYNDSGIRIAGLSHTPANSHNLFYSTGSNDGFTPSSTGLVTTNPWIAEQPEFAAPLNVRDSGGLPFSSAVDAGTNIAATSFGNQFDLTGEQRIIGSHVDIGAVEVTFDLSAPGSVTSTGTNHTAIDPWVAPITLRSDESIVATPVVTGVAGVDEIIGIFRIGTSPQSWRIFNQRGVTMSTGQRYHVLIPWYNNTSSTPGIGKYGFRHTTSCTPICSGGIYSNLSSGRGSIAFPDRLVNKPDAIAIATARYENPAGTIPATRYHDHPIGLEYASIVEGILTRSTWFVINQDEATLPASSIENVSFNIVIAAEGSPNAFKTPPVGLLQNAIQLNHPLLDNNPCATPVIGLNNSAPTPPLITPPSNPFFVSDVTYALQYQANSISGAAGHWFIVSTDDQFLTANSRFNVIVDGTQAAQCRSHIASQLPPLLPDALFSNGFE
jgi:hypothetical protein